MGNNTNNPDEKNNIQIVGTKKITYRYYKTKNNTKIVGTIHKDGISMIPSFVNIKMQLYINKVF